MLMGFSWQRFFGALLLALPLMVGMFWNEIMAGTLNVPLMLFVLILIFLVPYRAWPSLSVGRW